MNLGTAHIIRADARHLPLDDNSVDLVVTSPPYFALRSYQDGGAHYDGQIGDEATPAEFVDSLLEVTAECVRVLKPSGSLWVNLGDKYASGGGLKAQTFAGDMAATLTTSRAGKRTSRQLGIPEKSLIGIPWRYALRCIDDLGLILRAEVIWSKPNGLPESVTDRVRRSHEQWFHFVLNPRYFSAVDEIRESYSESSESRFRYGFNSAMKGRMLGSPDELREKANQPTGPSPLGKLPGSVWTVPTEPLRVPDHLGVDHFAAFPTAFPRRIIAGWSPAGVCVACGEGRRPVVAKEFVEQPTPRSRNYRSQAREDMPVEMRGGGLASPDYLLGRQSATITGYACACPEPTADTTPSVILDPFGGTGTVALVAKALGRTGISVDMSADYCRLAEWRTNDRDQLAKVLGVAKADGPTQDESLFDLLDGGAA